MILDAQNLFSVNQSLIGAAGITYSTNTIDTTAAPLHAIGNGRDIEIAAIVQQAFAGGTSLTMALFTADDSAFSVNSTQIQQSNVILEAALTAGSTHFKVPITRAQVRRYLMIAYTTVGMHTAGSMTTGLVLDRQEFNALPSGLNNTGF